MRAHHPVSSCVAALTCVFALCGFATTGSADAVSFVAPPRTIADISAILEQERPDPERIASQQAQANAVPPSTSDRRLLARFYFDRAEARGRLGRVREAVNDIEQSINYARGIDALLGRSFLLLGQLHGRAGDTKESLEAFMQAEPLTKADRRYNVTRWIDSNEHRFVALQNHHLRHTWGSPG